MKLFHLSLILLTFFTCGQKSAETVNIVPKTFEDKLSAAAISIIDPDVVYTPAYVSIKYPHIGIITNKKSPDGKRLMIVHNVGDGQVLEDCLFDWKIVGHFKYTN